jgi:hypothetical protein
MLGQFSHCDILAARVRTAHGRQGRSVFAYQGYSLFHTPSFSLKPAENWMSLALIQSKSFAVNFDRYSLTVIL